MKFMYAKFKWPSLRDSMIVGFTTTYAISTYHHWCCEFESLSELGVKHYVIKIVSELWQVGGFLYQYNWVPQYNWNVLESGVKYHQANKQTTFRIWTPF